MEKGKRIAIIGAGPGGLTLARILATRGVATTVFEAESDPRARPQGGSLDLHEDSGLRALRQAGLDREFQRYARYDDQGDVVYDHEGTLRFAHHEAGATARPEIDRTQLRQFLLESLPDGTVRWGQKIAAVAPLADGTVQVQDEIFDWVVGADGAWSKVRSWLSSERPRHTGVTFVEMQIEDVDTRHPQVAALLPHGKLLASGRSQGLIAQRNSGGTVRVYWMFRVSEEWNEVDDSDPPAARATLRRLLAGWSPKLLAFLEASGEHVVRRPIVALPIGHRWAPRRGLTLLGDAAHVMSPFAGEGVNMAMLDAAELALALATDADWSRAVAGYEAAMFERAARAAEESDRGLAFVSEQGLEHVLAQVRAITPPRRDPLCGARTDPR